MNPSLSGSSSYFSFVFFAFGGLRANSAATLFSPSCENARARIVTPYASSSGRSYTADLVVGNDPSVVYRITTSPREDEIVTAAIFADKRFVSIFGAGHATRTIASDVWIG